MRHRVAFSTQFNFLSPELFCGISMRMFMQIESLKGFKEVTCISLCILSTSPCEKENLKEIRGKSEADQLNASRCLCCEIYTG